MPPIAEMSKWSLCIMEARNFLSSLTAKIAEVDGYNARAQRCSNRAKREKMEALAKKTREQTDLLKEAFMRAVEEARKEEHHHEALKKEQDELREYRAKPHSKENYFDIEPSTHLMDLEKAYEEARKASVNAPLK